jgi:glycosyltransferase involved in cell wall biosynthesis
MKKLAILTDFRGYDEAYGLCQFVRNEVKILVRNGYEPRLILREGFRHDECWAAYPGTRFLSINPGRGGDNRVRIDGDTEDDIQRLEAQLDEALSEIDLVITHDLIFQANLWKHHVAARRLVKKRPDLRWLHVVHSASALGTVNKTGNYRNELEGKFPSSLLWVFSRESVERMGGLYGYEVDEIVVMPPPLDFLEYMHPITQTIVRTHDLMHADILIVYPCRLDKGKHPDVVIEIAAQLRAMHFDTRVVLVNSYSNTGAKQKFKEELKQLAQKTGVQLVLTSDTEGCEVRTPRQVVMNLFELGDVLIQPSGTESYSRILCEAAWHGCGLLLNYDLPLFREYAGMASFGKFSSSVDTSTGLIGNSTTEYADRDSYMRSLAAKITYHVENDWTLKLHRVMRQERSLEAIWPRLEAVIEGMS